MPTRIGTPMPDLEGATEWLTGSALEARELAQGHITLVHFWAVSCHICKENLPKVGQWRDTYKDKGVRVIAVHMPRYPADQDLASVREIVEKYAITEYCAIDNLHKLRDAFLNDQGFVPAYYLYDQTGKLKSYAAGEKGIDIVSGALQRLLATQEK